MSRKAIAMKSLKEKWLSIVQLAEEKGEKGIGGSSTVTVPMLSISYDGLHFHSKHSLVCVQPQHLYKTPSTRPVFPKLVLLGYTYKLAPSLNPQTLQVMPSFSSRFSQETLRTSLHQLVPRNPQNLVSVS